MGTRIHRITGKDIRTSVARVLNQKVQVVTWEGITYTGILISSNDRELVVEDVNAAWYNRKKHTHKIPVEEIREVNYDKASTW